MPAPTVTNLLSTAGTWIVEDDGIIGNNISRLRAPDGSTVDFEHPTTDLFFFASVPGATLVVNLTDSLGAANLTVGDLADSTKNPDQVFVRSVVTTGATTLVSNGGISELGNDAAPDIVSGTLILSGATGVGTASNALETQVENIEANTDTGGINLANLGALIIGGLTDLVDGLNVETSGNLTLTNVGSILLAEVDLDTGNPPPAALESVHGGNVSGNVTLVANGFDSDIIATVNRDAVTASHGNITLTAGRDVSLGAGASFDNDVRAGGSVTVTAGRDFLIDGNSDLASDGFGLNTGGDVVINAGRNIGILNSQGTDASVGATGNAGASATLTTGIGGTFFLNAPVADALSSQSGNVTVNADRMAIDAASAISAPGSTVILRGTTAGREIVLGSASDAAAAVELSSAELNRIFAGRLIIGDISAGQVSVIAPVSPLNVPDVELRSGTNVRVQASITVTNSLTLFAGDNVFVEPSTINAPTFRILVDQAGDDGGTGGIGDVNALVASTAAVYTGNAEADTLTGTSAAETIRGLEGNDVLRGAGGADTLDGGAGADRTEGGLGDDLHLVDNAGDVAVEAVGEGTDTVRSSVSYTIGANIENLQLTGATNISGTGNAEVNVLTGNDGDNTLDGKAGADIMNGGLGNDTYFADNSNDKAIESSAAGGFDQVFSAASFTLGTNVEKLTLTGGSAIDGTGNGGANILVGNNAANVLDGKAGADTMDGGGGNDTFGIDNAADTVTDSSGTDTVNSSITYTLAANLENLTLFGGAAINGTGNTSANAITGNAAINALSGGDGNDTLNGGAGADTMNGGIGNDTFVVDNVGDVVTEAAAAGIDTVQSSVTFTLGTNVENLVLTGVSNVNGTGNAVDNALTGNSGNNLLNGLAGADTMTGGGGNDTYVVDNSLDKAIEAAAGGTDAVQSSVSFTLGAELENLTLTGAGAINGAGNGLANTIVGNGAANVLNGLAGADAMSGGGGNDTYVVDNLGDTVVEAAGGGTDLVTSSVTFTLGADIEKLTLTGAIAIDGTGNSLANILIGNSAANTLDGSAGADTMNGAAGDDTYVVDNVGDVVVEGAGGGVDQVVSAISFTLGSNLENLSFSGTASLDGTGNTLANILGGNSGGNILKGLAGDDNLDGGAGADQLFGGAGNDNLIGEAGTDQFRFDAALNAATNVDDILDFNVAEDSIFLDRAIFSGIAANGTLAAGAFRAGSVAVDADDRILYDVATGNIFYDADGNGGTAAILFATVIAGTALTNADFLGYT